MSENTPFTTDTQCTRCWVGKLEPRFGTYTRIIDSSVVSFPNAPHSCCDVCGFRRWDVSFVNWVNQRFSSNSANSNDFDEFDFFNDDDINFD